jgi:lipase chaperone LimK
LWCICSQVTGSSAPKRLTRELVRRIFAAYGEVDLAANDALLDEMVKAANVDQAGGLLDTEVFATALTYDTRLCDLRNEVRLATNLDERLSRAQRRRHYWSRGRRVDRIGAK